MTQQIPSNTKLDKVMNQDQFNQVVDAILAGKYSWACLLILRFAGYNPLHYIPYRTYIRLVKENCQGRKSSSASTEPTKRSHKDAKGQKCLTEINDLNYLEEVDKQLTPVKGGTLAQWLNMTDREYEALKQLEQFDSWFTKTTCL